MVRIGSASGSDPQSYVEGITLVRFRCRMRILLRDHELAHDSCSLLHNILGNAGLRCIIVIFSLLRFPFYRIRKPHNRLLETCIQSSIQHPVSSVQYPETILHSPRRNSVDRFRGTSWLHRIRTALGESWIHAVAYITRHPDRFLCWCVCSNVPDSNDQRSDSGLCD